jgi:hypothetical protein
MYLGLGGGGVFGVLSLIFWGLRTLDVAGKRKAQDRRGRPAGDRDLADGVFLPHAPGGDARR